MHFRTGGGYKMAMARGRGAGTRRIRKVGSERTTLWGDVTTGDGMFHLCAPWGSGGGSKVPHYLQLGQRLFKTNKINNSLWNTR